MKHKLQKLVARYNDKKRDTKGRFVGGSGGISFPKDFNWRRALPVILVVALVGGYFVWQGFAASPDTTGTWKLTWSDEFNGSSVDVAKWNVFQNSTYGSGNNQDECNRAANVGVDGGSLNITAKREIVTCGGVNPDTGNKTYYFTSGAVTTRAQEGPLKFKYRHGYIEARIKTPKGNPYWPAFWLVSPNDGTTPGWPNYGEFDVFEGYGARPDLATGTFHYRCVVSGVEKNCNTTSGNIYNIKTDSTYQGSSNFGAKIDSATSFSTYSGGINDFVDYGFEWSEDQITWFVNGRKVRFFNKDGLYRVEKDGSTILVKPLSALGQPTTDLKTIFNYEHSIILNLAVGGNGPRYSTFGYTGIETATSYSEGNLAAELPGTMKVDYVRVYTPDETVDPPVPTPVKLPTPVNFKASTTVQGANLSWDASSDGRVSSYSARYIRSDSTTKDDGSSWSYPGRVSNTSQALSGLNAGVSYDFQIRAIDDTGVNPASDYTTTVKVTPLAPTQVGLAATYYTRTGFTGNFVSKTEQNVDFAWGTGAPVGGISENFSVRFSGQIVPPKTDDYTFMMKADDGAHLWIDGKPLIDSQQVAPLAEKTGTIRLEAGKAYDFDLDFVDVAGNAQLQLYWKTPGITQTIVPATAFRPTIKSGLSGRYSTRGAVVRYHMIRNDKTINFDWGIGSPDITVPADGYRVSWVGKIKPPTSGTYKLITYSDDGTQLWIDNSLIKNDWTDHGTKRNEATISLIGGKEYAINLRYYENKGASNAKLLWSGPGIAQAVVPSNVLTTN